jgi:type VI secretion system Hcp family effector
MNSKRRFHNRYPQSDTEDLRRRPDRHPGVAPLSEHRVVKMQHVIGNQAVQRLLAQRDIQAESHAGVQRAPGDKKDDSRPHALATLVLSNKGKLPGDSRIAGHEGKMEVLVFSFAEISTPDKRKTESDEQYVTLSVSRYIDQSSQSLMEAAAKGEHITSAKFELIKFDADGKVTVGHTFDFSDGLITSYQMNDSGDSDGRPIEVMNIQFPTNPKK